MLICKDHKQPKSKTKNLNSYFSEEDIEKKNRYMRKWSASLITREILIKTIRNHDLILDRKVDNRKTKDNEWQDVNNCFTLLVEI